MVNRKKIAKLFTYVFTTSLVILSLLRIFVIEPVHVKGISMEPTLKDGEYLLAIKIYSPLKTGDVIVLKSPEDGTLLIKRIIAKEGDSFAYNNGTLYVNGEKVLEPYLDHFRGQFHQLSLSELVNNGIVKQVLLTNDDTYKIPKGFIFVLGDNRPKSLDSDEFGLVPIENVISKVFQN